MGSGKIKRNTQLSREWNSWCGSIEDIRRLGKLADDLMSEHKRDLIAKRKEELGIVDSDASGQSVDKYNKVQLEEYEKRIQFSMIISHKGNSVEGDIDDVLPELDRRRVTEIEFCGGTSRLVNDLKISFRWNWFQKPVALSISSSNTGWANQAFARLSDEIDAGRPKVRLIHHWLGGWLFGILSVLSMGYSTYLILDKMTGSWRGGVVLLVAALTAGGVAAGLLSKKLFPALEIVADGTMGSSARRLVTIALSVLVAFIVGIVVNRLS